MERHTRRAAPLFFFALFYFLTIVAELVVDRFSLRMFTHWGWIYGMLFYLFWSLYCVRTPDPWPSAVCVWFTWLFYLLVGILCMIAAEVSMMITESPEFICREDGTIRPNVASIGNLLLHYVPIYFTLITVPVFMNELKIGMYHTEHKWFNDVACCLQPGLFFFVVTFLATILPLGIYRVCFDPSEVYEIPINDAYAIPIAIVSAFVFELLLYVLISPQEQEYQRLENETV